MIEDHDDHIVGLRFQLKYLEPVSTVCNPPIRSLLLVQMLICLVLAALADLEIGAGSSRYISKENNFC